MCKSYRSNINVLDDCSVLIDGEAEGYGVVRLCMSCRDSSALEDLIAYNEFDDWKALGKSNKTKQ